MKGQTKLQKSRGRSQSRGKSQTRGRNQIRGKSQSRRQSQRRSRSRDKDEPKKSKRKHTIYPSGIKSNSDFQDFKVQLFEIISESINNANNEGGKYFCSWVIDRSNLDTTQNFTQWQFSGESLVQDAKHDAPRADNPKEWGEQAIKPLEKIWGDSNDVNFNKVKDDMLELNHINKVTSILISVPSIIEQGNAIGPALGSDVMFAFDNGAKKEEVFKDQSIGRKQVVTCAQIYDTGFPVKLQDGLFKWPEEDTKFEKLGTLTVCIMNNQILVIFVNGRIINTDTVGCEGFILFSTVANIYDAKPHFFTESTLSANIKPVSKGTYYNGAKIYGMPKYFEEILKFIADRNQIIIGGHCYYYENQKKLLVTVSGDRYSLDEILRIADDSGRCMPFAYYGATKQYTYLNKDEPTSKIESVSSRILSMVLPVSKHDPLKSKRIDLMRKLAILNKKIGLYQLDLEILNSQTKIAKEAAYKKQKYGEEKMAIANAKIHEIIRNRSIEEANSILQTSTEELAKINYDEKNIDELTAQIEQFNNEMNKLTVEINEDDVNESISYETEDGVIFLADIDPENEDADYYYEKGEEPFNGNESEKRQMELDKMEEAVEGYQYEGDKGFKTIFELRQQRELQLAEAKISKENMKLLIDGVIRNDKELIEQFGSNIEVMEIYKFLNNLYNKFLRTKYSKIEKQATTQEKKYSMYAKIAIDMYKYVQELDDTKFKYIGYYMPLINAIESIAPQSFVFGGKKRNTKNKKRNRMNNKTQKKYKK